MKIFISYARVDQPLVVSLKNDLTQLGHEVWLDQNLLGGQAWWDEILQRIRDSQVYIFALSPQSIDSEACMAELGYANKLNRQLLPVMVSATNANYFPPEISHAQYVTYESEGRDSVMRLVASLSSLPPAPALPDPLPEPPSIPESPLYELRTTINQDSEITRARQLWVLDGLRRLLGNLQMHNDVADMLESFRRRPDIMADVADDVERLKADLAQAIAAPATAKRSRIPAWVLIATGLMLVAGLGLGLGLGLSGGGTTYPTSIQQRYLHGCEGSANSKFCGCTLNYFEANTPLATFLSESESSSLSANAPERDLPQNFKDAINSCIQFESG